MLVAGTLATISISGSPSYSFGELLLSSEVDGDGFTRTGKRVGTYREELRRAIAIDQGFFCVRHDV